MAIVGHPSCFKPETWTQNWPTMEEKYTLPDGRQCYARVKHPNIDLADAVGRGGVTFLQNDNTPSASRGLWIESIQVQSYNRDVSMGNPGAEHPGETLPNQVWIDFANDLPLVGFEDDEFLEGRWHMRNESSQYRAFKQRRAERYAAMALANNTYLSYGAFIMPHNFEWKVDGNPTPPTNNAFRQYYASPSAARNCAPFFFSNLADVTNPCIKYYPTAPYTAPQYYICKAFMEWVRKGQNGQGKLGYVSTNFLESLPDNTTPQGSVHNNCDSARVLPNGSGKVTTRVHPQWDYDQQLAMYFVCGYVIGTTSIAWDLTSLRGTDPNTIWNASAEDVEKADWHPTVPGTPPPYGNPGYSPDRQTWYDYCLIGANKRYSKCARTAGQPWVYVPYSVGGGAFTVTQSDGSDILFHAELKRGDCMARVSGNAVDFYYYNPMRRKNQYELVTVRVGGKDFTYRFKGKTLYVVNETLN